MPLSTMSTTTSLRPVASVFVLAATVLLTACSSESLMGPEVQSSEVGATPVSVGWGATPVSVGWGATPVSVGWGAAK